MAKNNANPAKKDEKEKEQEQPQINASDSPAGEDANPAKKDEKEKEQEQPQINASDSPAGEDANPAKKDEKEKRTFLRTYVGDAGVFYAGKSYALTTVQQAFFKGDLE